MLMKLSLARLEDGGHKATWNQRGGIPLIQPPGAPLEPDARHESVVDLTATRLQGIWKPYLTFRSSVMGGLQFTYSQRVTRSQRFGAPLLLGAELFDTVYETPAQSGNPGRVIYDPQARQDSLKVADGG
jgi:hypothetical protein